MLKLKTLTFLLLIVTALTFVYAEETTVDSNDTALAKVVDENPFKDHAYYNPPFGGEGILLNKLAFKYHVFSMRWTGPLPHIDYGNFKYDKEF